MTTSSFLSSSLLAALAALTLPLTARSQGQAMRNASPQIGYVYPAGAKQGTTVLVTFGGQGLARVDDVTCYGPGVTTRVLTHLQPLTQKQFQDLREEGEKLQAKRAAMTQAPSPGATAPAWTEADTSRAAEIRALMGYRVNRQLAPAIAEAVTVELTLAPDAPPGPREFRLHSPDGLSNPLSFWVGTLPEFSEVPAHPNTAPPGERGPAAPEPKARPPVPRDVTLPAWVSGQILPGEVDRIRFHAHAGQRIIASVQARSLIPYLADAVPGWFQAVLRLTDEAGREVAFNDDSHFNPDPTLSIAVPRDGTYVLEINDALYRGRQDFIYRIALGELPLITGLFPLGGTAGQSQDVRLEGWNLRTTQAIIDGRVRAPGRMEFSCQTNGLPSNAVAFAFDRDPEQNEAEPNDFQAPATLAALPLILNGRIDRPGDVDAFRFHAEAQQPVVIEVVARRLQSPLDSRLELLDPNGKVVATNDDTDDKAAGLLAHQADSRIYYVPIQSGVHTVRLSDSQHQGGSTYAYRLHLRPARPDFELRVTPSAINLRAGTHQPITVYALRHDGFDGPIELGIQGRAGVFLLNGGRIPPGQDSVRLTLTTQADAGVAPQRVTLHGRATLNGRVEVREAVPCDDRMQAFAYHHLVTARELLVTVVGNSRGFRSPLRLLDRPPLRLTGGAPTRLRVAVPAVRSDQSLHAELSDGPAGIALTESNVRGENLELVFTADPAKIKPGTQGNLIVRVSGERSPADRAKGPNRTRSPAVTLPAIPYEIQALSAERPQENQRLSARN
ncbi:MAG: hypothetical protein JNN01_00925 [Opitutaceae bacterium]|nr:hypothetical protein [Opitutaceae bacterium]